MGRLITGPRSHRSKVAEPSSKVSCCARGKDGTEPITPSCFCATFLTYSVVITVFLTVKYISHSQTSLCYHIGPFLVLQCAKLLPPTGPFHILELSLLRKESPSFLSQSVMAGLTPHHSDLSLKVIYLDMTLFSKLILVLCLLLTLLPVSLIELFIIWVHLLNILFILQD
jgi:hypothetical protein